MKRIGNKVRAWALALMLGLSYITLPIYAADDKDEQVENVKISQEPNEDLASTNIQTTNEEVTKEITQKDVVDVEEALTEEPAETISKGTEPNTVIVEENLQADEIIDESGNGKEELLKSSTMGLYTTNNAGGFNVVGDESGWIYSQGVLTVVENGDYFIEGNDIETADRIVIAEAVEAHITLHKININTNNPAISLLSGAKATLNISDNNMITAYNAVLVPSNAQLIIEGKGTLLATQQMSWELYWYVGALIGSNAWESTGTITINDSTLILTGNGFNAGIGTGYGGQGGYININGGRITVRHDGEMGGAAGIGGGGEDGYVDQITINGGYLDVEVGSEGAGIGGGKDSPRKTILITGGTVTARGGIYYGGSSGIGTGLYGTDYEVIITGGTIKSLSPTNQPVITGPPIDREGRPRYLLQLTNQSGATTVIVDGKNYNIAGNHVEDDSLYIYLTADDHNIIVDGRMYKATWHTEDQIFTWKLYESAAPTPTITIASASANSITVEELADQESYGEAVYKLADGNWQTSPSFSNLKAGITFTIYAKYLGNDDYFESGIASKDESTSAAAYTVTIPTVTLEAGNADSITSISVNTQERFDLGYGGQVNVRVSDNGAVNKDGLLTLTRDDTNGSLKSVLLVDAQPFGNIDKNVATFKTENDELVEISFAKPISTEETIPAGTYNGVITFEISYSQ